MDLATPRLVLRPLARGDAPALRGIVTRPEVGRMPYLFPAGMTVAQAGTFIDDWAWRGGTRMRLGIEAGGRLVGSIGASDGAEPEIVCFLAPEAWGRGLAREAVTAFCAALFDRFGVPALRAWAFTDNAASARVLEACGFVRTGEGTGTSAQRLEPAPVWLYRMPRADREARR